MRRLLLFLWAFSAGSSGAALAAPPPTVGQDVQYRVRSGDNLFSVAEHFDLAAEQVAFANRLSIGSSLQPGKTLVIPLRHILPRRHPASGIVVNLPERGLYLFKQDHFVAFYPLAVGKPSSKTPLGQFKIISMVKNPTWVPPAFAGPNRRDVPPGPNNPLGDRWIGLSAPGIGIHSTNAPLSVGGDVSHGCMRMYEPRVHALFAQVHQGMPVWIEYETVKFGLSDNQLVGQVYPDIYQHNDSARRAEKLLVSQGLGSRVPPQRLRKWLAHRSGRVVPLQQSLPSQADAASRWNAAADR